MTSLAITQFPDYKYNPQTIIVDNRFEYTIRPIWIDPVEENVLSFMDTFQFPPLEELRKSLEATNIYSKEEIDEEIKALSELPEYKH